MQKGGERVEKGNKKQKSRRYKKYIRKQIKKALDERLFGKLNFTKNKLPDVRFEIENIRDISPHYKADWH